MKRAGFTMIELIFVIVILGILAAVALPKFTGVSEQAKVGKLQAYIGTLNRTVLPTYWSESIMNGNNGSLNSDDKTININADLTPPDELLADFSNLALQTYDFNATVAIASGTAGFIGSQTYNGTLFTIVCKDGSAVNAPLCDVFNGATNKYILHNNQ